MKFSIRDLLWLIVVAALVLEWRVDRSKLAGKVEELEREIEANKSPYHWTPMPNSHAPAPKPPKP